MTIQLWELIVLFTVTGGRLHSPDDVTTVTLCSRHCFGYRPPTRKEELRK